MSILIRGMEMPKSCRECSLKMNCDDCEGWECVCVPLHQQIGYLDDLLADKRRDDCPLVPVPPHGRLIDADALDGIMVEQSGEEYNHHHAPRTWERALSCFRDYINDAPTIIPADPVEEGE